jgi:hypothetical protein
MGMGLISKENSLIGHALPGWISLHLASVMFFGVGVELSYDVLCYFDSPME